MFSKLIRNIYRIVKIMEQNMVFVLLAIMVSNVAIGVFFRYVLNNSLPWTEEMARYLMIWFAFIGMAIAFRDEEHVNVSFVLNLFPIPIRSFIKIISYLLVLFFLVTLFFQSLNVLRVVKIQISPALGIPMIYPYLAVTFGSILMAIEVISLLCANVSAIFKE